MLANTYNKIVDKNVLAVCSNVMKQMNVKLNGDLFELQLSGLVGNKRTMLVGIDSSNQGKDKARLAFVSTYNQQMTKYLT